MAANPVLETLGRFADGAYSVAAAHGANEYILPIVEMTHRVFSGVRSVSLQLEDDPVIEDADEWRIVFAVEVACPAAEAADGILAWYEGLFECCPAPKAVYFRLGLQVVD